MNEQIGGPGSKGQAAVFANARAGLYKTKPQTTTTSEPRQAGVPRFKPGQQIEIANNNYHLSQNDKDPLNKVGQNPSSMPFHGYASVISDDGNTLKIKVSTITVTVKGNGKAYRDKCVSLSNRYLNDWRDNVLNLYIDDESMDYYLSHSYC